MAGPLRPHVWNEYTDVLILIANLQIPIFGVIVGLGVRFALKSDYHLNFPWTELLTCSLMYCFPILFSVNSWWGLKKSTCQTRPSPGNVSTKLDELYLFVKRQHWKVCQQWHGYILPVLNVLYDIYRSTVKSLWRSGQGTVTEGCSFNSHCLRRLHKKSILGIRFVTTSLRNNLNAKYYKTVVSV